MGHVFRDKSPYTFPGGVAKIVLHNAARVAEVWLDEWRDFYYAMSTGSLKNKIQKKYRKIPTNEYIDNKQQQVTLTQHSIQIKTITTT